MGVCMSRRPRPLLQNYGPGSSSPQHVITIGPTRSMSETSKERITMRLHQGRTAGRDFQQKVALPLALGAGLLLVALLAMTWINASTCAQSGKGAASCGLSAQFVPFMGTPTVAIVLLLAILPTQTALVAVAGWVAFTLDLGVGTMMAVDLSLALYNSPNVSKGSCADIFTHEQQSCVQMSALAVGFFTWFYIGVTGSYKLARMMRDKSLQTRSRLEQVWLLLGTDFLIGGLVPLPGLILKGLINGSLTQEDQIMLGGVVQLASYGALMRSRKFRVQIHAFLASRAQAVTTAVGIAAMIGDAEPELVQALAIAMFRAVPLDRVTCEAMALKKPDPTLQQLSEHAMLDGVDAFVSHSWNDGADAKWEQLQAWRKDFVAKNNREPVVWIDKYCINAFDVENSLKCLPVWIAGCNQLVALVGKSYHTRLWCLMELFTYDMMGGAAENITVLTLNDGTGTAEMEVDVREAECSSPRDRELLLSIIEAGVGVTAFNDWFNARIGYLHLPLLQRRTSVTTLGGHALVK